MAGAEECVGLMPCDQVGRHTYGGARLSTRGRCRIRHLDHIGRFDDVDLERTPVCVTVERGRDRCWDSNEKYLEVEMAGGGKSAVHDGGRRVVATHRVNGDANHLDAGIDEFTN